MDEKKQTARSVFFLVPDAIGAGRALCLAAARHEAYQAQAGDHHRVGFWFRHRGRGQRQRTDEALGVAQRSAGHEDVVHGAGQRWQGQQPVVGAIVANLAIYQWEEVDAVQLHAADIVARAAGEVG